MRVGAAMMLEASRGDVGEKQNIGAALAERRNRQQQNIQPEIKIFAEAAGLYGGGRSTLVRAMRRASMRSVSVPPRRSKVRSCKTRRSLPWAPVERAATSSRTIVPLPPSSNAEFAFDGAGESAALVAEEFALHEIWRKAGAINLQEGCIAARAEFVHEACEVVFAGTAFAGDQKSCRCDGDFLGQFKEAERCGILGDPR